MVQFVFTTKQDSQQCTLTTDAISINTETFTIMQCDGVRGTCFEKIIPWKCGTVVSMYEIKMFAQQYNDRINCIAYYETNDGTKECECINEFNAVLDEINGEVI